MPSVDSKRDPLDYTLQTGTYIGTVDCGPCKFAAVVKLKAMQDHYDAKVSIKNEGSSACPIQKYEGPAEFKDNGNGTVTAKGVVPFFNKTVEQTIPVTKGNNNSFSLSTSLFGMFSVKAQATLDTKSTSDLLLKY